jgi:hypothetical protein
VVVKACAVKVLDVGGVRAKARDQVNVVDVDGNDILQRRC